MSQSTPVGRVKVAGVSSLQLENRELHVVVRSVEGDENVTVTLTWGATVMNLNRSKTEPLGKMLQRLRLNVEKASGKGKKKQQGDQKKNKGGQKGGAVPQQGQPAPEAVEAAAPAAAAEDEMAVCLLLSDNSKIPEDTLCGDAFGRAAWLCIGPQRLSVHCNPPSIKALQVNSRLIARCPVVANLELEFAKESDFTFEWWRLGKQAEEQPKLVGNGMVYVPVDLDVGHQLELRGYHATLPEFATAVQLGPVEPGPPRGWREERNEAFRRENAHDKTIIRVASFNILAAVYARTPVAIYQMYPYCAESVLDITYRKPLLAKEIQDIDGDIVCLQECAVSVFEYFFCKLYEDEFHALITPKLGRVKEGCGLLLRKSAFEIVSTRDVEFRTEFATDEMFAETRADIAKKWQHFLTEVLPHMTTIFQIVCARHIHTGRLVVIANTHLFFHPDAQHIRILQAAVMLRAIQTMCDAHTHANGGQRPAVILCGDLNASPTQGAIHLLKHGHIEPTHPSWFKGPLFKWARDEDAMDVDEKEEKKEEKFLQTHDAPHTHTPERKRSDDMHVDGSKTEDIKAGVEPSMEEKMKCPDIHGIPCDPAIGLHIDAKAKGCWPELADAYGDLCGVHLPFSNYVNGFQATLDWILVDRSQLAVTKVLGPVKESDMQKHGGLPSVEYASDHLAIAAELKFV